MRAVVVRQYGGPEVLRLAEVPEPEPGQGEVTIGVRFAGVNFTDVRNRIGDGLGVVPFVPGVEVAGTVRHVGDGVSGLSPGQPVAALTRGHGYAEVVSAAADLTVPLPQNLAGRPQAGGMLVTVPLALMLLRRVARVLPEETVLLHGAAGGVGTVTGQLARHWGLRPLLGTASSAAKAEFARGYGYSHVFGYTDFAEGVLAATAGRGVDVVLDPVGGQVRARSFELLTPFGRLVTYSNISREPELVPDAAGAHPGGVRHHLRLAGDVAVGDQPPERGEQLERSRPHLPADRVEHHVHAPPGRGRQHALGEAGVAEHIAVAVAAGELGFGGTGGGA